MKNGMHHQNTYARHEKRQTKRERMFLTVKIPPQKGEYGRKQIRKQITERQRQEAEAD